MSTEGYPPALLSEPPIRNVVAIVTVGRSHQMSGRPHPFWGCFCSVFPSSFHGNSVFIIALATRVTFQTVGRHTLLECHLTQGSSLMWLLLAGHRTAEIPSKSTPFYLGGWKCRNGCWYGAGKSSQNPRYVVYWRESGIKLFRIAMSIRIWQNQD